MCENKQQSATSDTGGWCNTAVATGHATDKRLVDLLANLFTGRTVVGLGEGPGKYRKLILETGKVRKYDGYDGAPYINNITGGQVVFRSASTYVTTITQKLVLKVLPTASHKTHIHFHRLGYVLEDIVVLFPYALTTFVNPFSFSDVYFVFLMITDQCFVLLHRLLYYTLNICVCHLF